MKIAASRITLAAALLAPLPVIAQSADSLEKMAGLINGKGHLCARAIDIKPMPGQSIYIVNCVESRNGAGRVSYVVDLTIGKVSPR